MHISDAEIFVVGNPPPSFGGRYFVFVKLVTNDGIVGYGEVYKVPFHPSVVAQMVRDVIDRCVIGHDPFRIEALWRSLYSQNFTQRPDTSMMGVLSGLEMACWDIIGKASNRPVYDLLGGLVHERVRTYTYLYPAPGADDSVYTDPDLAAETAARAVAEGFTGVKFDPLGPYTVYDPRQPGLEALSASETFVAKVREAVGDKADILFGTHGQMSPTGALRLARRLEPYDPLWLEEPCPPDRPEAMAQVAAGTCIPVAAGERLTTKYEFARVLELKAAAILQLTCCVAGGMLEAKKIAGMAEAFHVQIAPHLYSGPISGMANAQLAACSPNFLVLEGIGKWDGFHADLLEKPVQWQDGYLIPPTEPGLGVTLNEAVARAHPYTGEALHLGMHPSPVI